MKALKRISAVLLGSVFFIAGILKLMDPLGTSLIVEAYLKFLHLGFLRPLSTVIGEGLALFETLLGAAVITGVWKMAVSGITLFVLGGFSLLVIMLEIFDAKMDCGCFGEAIHLTHFQSFMKNVGLLALWALAFIPRNFEPPRKAKYVAMGITGISVAAFMVFFLINIPAKDFTVLSPGAELLGEQDAYSETDPTLSFSDADGNYADSLVLTGRVMVFSVYDPGKLDEKDKDRIGSLSALCREAGIEPMELYASTPDDHPGVFYADRRDLMTLNRANGGATYISDGQIVAKWRPGKFPDADNVRELAENDPIESLIKENTSQKLKFQGFLLYVFAVMLLL